MSELPTDDQGAVSGNGRPTGAVRGGIKALGVYLMNYQLLPYERTTEVLGDLFGCSMSAGTLYGAGQACAEGLAEIEEQIKQGVRQAEVAHFDETGLDIEGKRQWLHVSSTQTLTHYGSHAKRGKEATESIGILPGFDGTAVHDSWSSYRQYACAHALCPSPAGVDLHRGAGRAGVGWGDEGVVGGDQTAGRAGGWDAAVG